LLKDKTLQSKIMLTDSKVLESIVTLVFADSLMFAEFPYQLVKTLCLASGAEYKIMDALMFLLNFEDIPRLKQLIGGEESQFPLLKAYQGQILVTDYSHVYSLITLKILYIFSKMSQYPIAFFTEA